MRAMKIIFTGAAGFVGPAVCRHVLGCSRLRMAWGTTAQPWQDRLATCIARLCEISTRKTSTCETSLEAVA
jgi:hypothetical protein